MGVSDPEEEACLRTSVVELAAGICILKHSGYSYLKDKGHDSILWVWRNVEGTAANEEWFLYVEIKTSTTQNDLPKKEFRTSIWGGTFWTEFCCQKTWVGSPLEKKCCAGISKLTMAALESEHTDLPWGGDGHLLFPGKEGNNTRI